MKNIKQKLAFTMIELIFVIVIIGILAAVAIPRLAATRDDAKIVICMDEASSFIQQVTAYYTSQGRFGKISEMTNFHTDATAANKLNGFTNDAELNVTQKVVTTYMCDGGVVMTIDTIDESNEASIRTQKGTSFTANQKVAKQTADALDDRNFFTLYMLGGEATIKF